MSRSRAVKRAVVRRRRSRARRGLQQIKNTCLYVAMRAATGALQRLPMRGFIRLFGCVSPFIFRREARRAEAQLRRTLPYLDATKVTRRMFVHFAESLWELTRLRRSIPVLDQSTREVFDNALAEGRGAIVISGHVGNWEILGQAIAVAGYPLTTIATPFYDPRITRWMNSWRTQFGLKILWRESNNGKAILRVLRRNEMMAFLIDQNTKTSGDYVLFFGRKAFTPTHPAALALRTGAAIIFCWHQRRGKQHRIRAERLRFAPSGDRDRDVLNLTAVLTARLEQVIREAPEQWVWMHRRWRTKHRLPLTDSTPAS